MGVVSKTLRIDEALNDALKLLGELRGQPVNAVINQALNSYVGAELAQEETSLAGTLHSLREYRRKFSDFSAAIDDVARSEGKLERDPAEGKILAPANSLTEELGALLNG